MIILANIDWADAIGRWHPVLLHLPIGILLALGWLRLRKAGAEGAERSLLVLLALSTFGAGLTGWLLHESGTYPDPVEWHEYLGIAVLALSFVLLWAHGKKPRAYTPLLVVTVLLLVPTAHLGGTLTHGEGFLFDPWTADVDEKVEFTGKSDLDHSNDGPNPADPALPLTDEQRFALVEPILVEKCGRCHGERKRKGGLALHTWAAVQAGGDTGAVLDTEVPEDSELWMRLHLPLDDEERMPPKNKRQLTESEIAQLKQWVWGGETLDAGSTVAQSAPKTHLAHKPDLPALSGAPYAEALAVLDRARVTRAPYAAGDARLTLNWAGASDPDDAQLQALHTLREHVVELRFAGRPVPSVWMAEFGKLPRLAFLDLSRCQPENADLQGLEAAPRLRKLLLANTPLASGAVQTLLTIQSLETVSLAGTGLSETNWATLYERKATRWLGDPAPVAAVLEQEPEVVFEEYEAPGDASKPENSATSLNAINVTCPITGRPVDSNYRIVFEDRIIGFCCANCLGQFADSPEEFRSGLPAESE